MRFKKLSSKKSRTIGILDQQGRTKFKKVDFQAEIELDENDDPVESRRKLSQFIDDYLIEEAKK